MSFEDTVRLLDETQVVAIVTTRKDGTAVATPIWSVVIDGVPYLRSAYGPDSWWYRHVIAGRPTAFAMGDGAIAERRRGAALTLPRRSVSTVYVPVHDAVQHAIDDEIRRKYAAAPPSSVASMLSAEAVACTLRVEAPTGDSERTRPSTPSGGSASSPAG